MRRVTFLDTNPCKFEIIPISTDGTFFIAEKEFFEEYNKYNASWWLVIVIIFRCFAPFSLALQAGIFEFSGSIDIYLREFSVQNNCSKEKNQTDDVNKVLRNCRKTVFLWMNFYKNIGLFLGATFGGILSDVFGRRKLGLCFSTIGTLSSEILIFASNEYFLRFLYVTTIASGTIVDTVTLTNCAEISNKKYRFLVLYTTSSYIVGDIIANFLTRTILLWKYEIVFLTTVNFITIFLCWYMPESPPWLLTNNQSTRAYQELEEISGKLYRVDEINDRKTKKMKLLRLILLYFFKKRRKNFILLSLSMFIACLSYHSAKSSELLRNINSNEFGLTTGAAEILSYILLLPVHDFLWKRCGLFFISFLLTLRSLIAILIHSITEDVYYNAFGVLFGHTAICLNWLYFIEIFPTFARGSAVGCSNGIFAVAAAISLLFAQETFDRFAVYVIMVIFSGLGASVMFLPEIPLNDLPNHKPN